MGFNRSSERAAEPFSFSGGSRDFTTTTASFDYFWPDRLKELKNAQWVVDYNTMTAEKLLAGDIVVYAKNDYDGGSIEKVIQTSGSPAFRTVAFYRYAVETVFVKAVFQTNASEGKIREIIFPTKEPFYLIEIPDDCVDVRKFITQNH
jgi:hypothetical protein